MGASPHGNYVIQKIVEVMPASVSGFISGELLGSGVEMAYHRFGCRVLQRLLEHCSRETQTVLLIGEIVQAASGLCRHNFGHHVMDSILEHGLEEHKHKIVTALLSDSFVNATDVNAPYVIEWALQHCCSDDKRILTQTFLADRNALVLLAEHICGFHVVLALLKYSEECSAISAMLYEVRHRLERNDNGRKVLQVLQGQGGSSNVGKA